MEGFYNNLPYYNLLYAILPYTDMPYFPIYPMQLYQVFYKQFNLSEITELTISVQDRVETYPLLVSSQHIDATAAIIILLLSFRLKLDRLA